MELVKSVSIANLLSKRDGIIERLDAMRRLVGEIDELAGSCGLCGAGTIIGEGSHRRYGAYYGPLVDNDGKGAEEMRRRIDTSGWDLLMKESGLRTFMDAQAREAWANKIATCDVPPLTLENIEATLRTLHDSRGDLFERGVIECFRRLSWCYKTNNPAKFGKRIIVRGIGNIYAGNRTCDQLDDLVRCFCVLDGKPEPDHRDGIYYQVSDAIREHRYIVENEYLSIRRFKNANGHVTFKRLDLVDGLNDIIAKHYPGCLPATRGNDK